MAGFYTYLHCKPDGTPFYVGKGNKNRAYCLNGRKNPYHKNIIAKYGKKNIGIFVFPCDSEQQAFDDEVQQITQLRREGYDLCNMTDGGEGISNPSTEVRNKISETLKSKKLINPMLGKKHSDEILKKMSIAHIGKKQSVETRKKLSLILIGNTRTLGFKHSLSTRAKMSSVRIGKKHSKETLAKLSEAQKKRLALPEQRLKFSTVNIGRKHTEESRKNMRIAHLGNKASLETRTKMSASQKIRWEKKRQTKENQNGSKSSDRN